MNMEMMKQFTEMNPGFLESISVSDYSGETFWAQQEQSEIPANWVHNNLSSSTFNSNTGHGGVLPVHRGTSSIIGDYFDQRKTRIVNEESTSNSQNKSSAKIAASSSTRKKNNLGKGKKSRSSEKEMEKSEEVIHVRAKRGQATDSHSIAERVRREKINKKMKCLQDLVPGCNKMMGMAVMLEEIINYVHSLQNQVEFLSMELAAACSPYDFNHTLESIRKAQGTNPHEAEEMEKWVKERYGEQNCFQPTWPL